MQNPELVDCIGVESYIDFTPNAITTTWSATISGGAKTFRRTPFRALNDFPPPIPSRLMKRSYTTDGRLIITEEKVKSREYFKASRSNGRLVLDLVLLDDAVEESEGALESGVGETDGGDECDDDPVAVVEEELVERRQFNAAGCVEINSCGGLGVAPPPLRPQIHI